MQFVPVWEIVYSNLVVSANGRRNSVSVLPIAYRKAFGYCMWWKMEVLS